MKADISPTLRKILADTRREIDADKARTSAKRLKQMLRDAVPVLSFASALSPGNALIAELKERSPSQGKMRRQNVAAAPAAYKDSPMVKAISVLTSWTHFGEHMRVGMMEAVKKQTAKPVLRKDFMLEEYQVYQARAYGADAILLMANILEADEMQRLSALAFELGMDVLFETHCADQLDHLPKTARIVGINRRTFDGGARSFKVARFFRQWLGAKRDRSIDPSRFEYADKLPASVIKVAESGVAAADSTAVFAMGFHSILVGTSLLIDRRGVSAALGDFETAMREAKRRT